MSTWTTNDSGYPSNTACGEDPSSTTSGSVITRDAAFSSVVSAWDDGDLVDGKFSDRTCSTLASLSFSRRTAAASLALDTDSDDSEGSARSDSQGNESDDSQGSSRRGERRAKHRTSHEENLELGDGAQVFDMATPVGGKIKVTPGVEVFNMITPRSDEENENTLVSTQCPSGGISVQPGVAVSTSGCRKEHSALPAAVDQASGDSRLFHARIGLLESRTPSVLPEVDAHESEEQIKHTACLDDSSARRNATSYDEPAQDDSDCDHVSWESSSIGSLESVGSDRPP